MSLSQIFKGTLIFLAAVALAYILVLTLNVWVGLLIAILVASAVHPAISQLTRWRIPQSLAVLIVYLELAVVTVTLLLIVLPPVVNQFVSYIQNDERLAKHIIDAQSWVQQTHHENNGNRL